MTREEEALFWRVIRHRLRDWEQSPEYDDILAEAAGEAFRAYAKAQARGCAYPLAVIGAAAAVAPSLWQRKWVGRRRDHTAARFWPRLSLEELLLSEQSEDDCTRMPHSEGFEAEAVERLWQEWLWQRMETVCTPRMAEVLGHMMAGKTMQQTADSLGLSRRGVEAQYYRALERCRERLR